MDRLALSEVKGLLNDLFDKLSGKEWREWLEALKKFLRKENPWRVAEAAAEKILEFVGVVAVDATDKFVANEHFVIDTSASAEVKIGYLGNNFKNLFIDKIEERNIYTGLCYHQLKKDSPDEPILDELGYLSETALSHVWELLKLQPRGENGVLLTNGFANIFYVRDIKGVLRTVYVVSWSSYGYWGVDAISIKGPVRWCAGGRLFSRNS